MGSTFRLNKDVIAPPPGSRVIKKANAMSLLEANALLAAAKERAAAIEIEAQVMFERRKEEGYQDGLEQGRMEHAEKLMETVLSSVAYIEGIESKLVDVVCQAVSKVIGEMDSDERIVRIVRHSLHMVRSQQRVVIRVCPSDEKAVRNALSAFLQSVQGGSSFIELLADERLEPGACLLESELGVVDASLQTQLEALRRAFRSKIES